MLWTICQLFLEFLGGILDKCKNNVDKALFYVRKTLENNRSRDVLLIFLNTDLFERQGKAVTNF